MRGFKVLLALAIVFGLEGARLAWLQLGIGSSRTASGTLRHNATAQRSDELALDSGRGSFVDRYGRPLAGISVRGLAAFPDNGMPRGTDEAVGRLAAALGTDAASFGEWLDNLRASETWKIKASGRTLDLSDRQIAEVNRAGLIGVSVVPYVDRYGGDLSPLHAIGFVSQHPERVRAIYGDRIERRRMNESSEVGGSGLEKSLDRLIQGIGPTRAAQVTSGSRLPLGGLGLRLLAGDNPHFPLRVTTTIDKDAQRIAEDVLAKHGVRKGAAVVLDAANADILAMVSLPKLNPYRIGEEGTDERNHALTGVPPGSVFKTVTLAAALESGIASWDEKFHCDGHYGKYGLKCWKEGGHGELTLREAYAQSCNVAFAGLAEKLDPAWLQITADRLGLGRQVGWHTESFADGKPLRLLGEEEAGTVFADKKTAYDGGMKTGTGIGQRNVRVTPLQVANMAVTIVHDGKAYSPRIVKELRYADGNLLAALPVHAAKSKHGAVSAETMATLRQGMRTVVTEGTAKSALSGAVWPLAGKSGTAELAGKSEGRNDQWFVGYGPATGKPRYAIAVLIEDQPAGVRNRGAALFGEIMDGLRLLERERRL
ncbi:peptidoglycan D,D-transpeptidase FtsI family protein [Cohnella suwonensis]|uniref:Peptidoglycan D,D-transpeptidase FtsI family protein n=1 Tax=Cohnella suwonensis TaxID=696072 RepID=A0ABW0M2A0_9BACL